MIIAGLVAGIAITLGWAFELPLLDGTVDVGTLISDAVLYGAAAGLLLGLVLARSATTAIGKFQVVASSVLLLSAGTALLAHYTNRKLTESEARISELPVKEVTKTWAGRGVSRLQLSMPPDGYYIFFETPSGLIRLRQDGATAPDVGPTRMLPVITNEGYWGYVRYRLPSAEELAQYNFGE